VAAQATARAAAAHANTANKQEHPCMWRLCYIIIVQLVHIFFCAKGMFQK
jgi:hypothetical protein